MPTSLVTGAAGFIGSHVAEHLLRAHHTVIAVDDLSGGYRDNVPEGARFVHADVTNALAMQQVFNAFEPDYVFHLAAYAAEGLSHFIRRFNYTNNVLGSVVLINEAVKHRVRRFVFTSSLAVYGEQEPPFHEAMTPQPVDPYGIAKYAVELDLHAAHEMFGLDFTIFRPHNVYGERQNFADKYRNVIGIFLNQLMHDEPLTIFGDGLQTRAFSYIDDVAPPIARCVDVEFSRNHVYNIGADQPYTVIGLADAVTWAYDGRRKLDVVHLPARNEVEHAYTDHSKLRRVFGEYSPTPLAIGLRRMAEWAKQVGPRATPQFEGIEVERNLPPSWARS